VDVRVMMLGVGSFISRLILCNYHSR